MSHGNLYDASKPLKRLKGYAASEHPTEAQSMQMRTMDEHGFTRIKALWPTAFGVAMARHLVTTRRMRQDSHVPRWLIGVHPWLNCIVWAEAGPMQNCTKGNEGNEEPGQKIDVSDLPVETHH